MNINMHVCIFFFCIPDICKIDSKQLTFWDHFLGSVQYVTLKYIIIL